MAIFEKTRYWNSIRGLSLDDKIVLTERTPFYFTRFRDNIEHTVTDGDTFQSIAFYYYTGYLPASRSAAELWWVIADFQPTPVTDPTLRLEAGTTVYVPSLRILDEFIFSKEAP